MKRIFECFGNKNESQYLGISGCSEFQTKGSLCETEVEVGPENCGGILLLIVCRISITFRKMDPLKVPLGFVEDKELQGVCPAVLPSPRPGKENC